MENETACQTSPSIKRKSASPGCGFVAMAVGAGAREREGGKRSEGGGEGDE